MQLQQYMLTKTAQRLCMFLSSCFVVSFQNWVDFLAKRLKEPKMTEITVLFFWILSSYFVGYLTARNRCEEGCKPLTFGKYVMSHKLVPIILSTWVLATIAGLWWIGNVLLK